MTTGASLDSSLLLVWTQEEVKCEFAKVRDLPRDKKVIDFSTKQFSSESFEVFYRKLEKNFIEKLVLNKTSLTEDQTNRVLALVNSNEKKGLLVNNEVGDPFGPVYTDYSTYYEEKRKEFTDQLRAAALSSFLVKAYKEILNETVSRALDYFDELTDEERLIVIDFGCGEGKDSIPIKRIYGEKAEIIGVDSYLPSIDYFKKILLGLEVEVSEEEMLSLLEKEEVGFHTGAFVNFTPLQLCNLFISSFSWPYRPPEDFGAVWEKTKACVAQGGIIAGHFFGAPEKPNSGMTYHTQEEVEALLGDGFEILWIFTEKDGIRPNGSKREIFGGEDPAWGELHHVIARKL